MGKKGTQNPAGDPAGQDPSGSAEAAEAELRSAFDRMVTSHGGAHAAGLRLFREGFGYREKIRDLKEALTAAKAGKGDGLKDGEVAVSAERAAKLDAYEALGEDPEKLKEALDSGEQARTQLQQRDRDTQHRKILKEAGVDAAAFLKLTAGRGLELLTDEVPGEGDDDTVKAHYVKGSDGKRVPLKRYVRDEFPEFEAVLLAEPSDDGDKGEGSGKRLNSGLPPGNDRKRDKGKPGTKSFFDGLRKEVEAEKGGQDATEKMLERAFGN